MRATFDESVREDNSDKFWATLLPTPSTRASSVRVFFVILELCRYTGKWQGALAPRECLFNICGDNKLTAIRNCFSAFCCRFVVCSLSLFSILNRLVSHSQCYFGFSLITQRPTGILRLASRAPPPPTPCDLCLSIQHRSILANAREKWWKKRENWWRSRTWKSLKLRTFFSLSLLFSFSCTMLLRLRFSREISNTVCVFFFK